MPCLRHTSAVFAPASCSCRIAMICSSLNRLRFIVRPPSGGRTLLKSGGASGAQVMFNEVTAGRKSEMSVLAEKSETSVLGKVQSLVLTAVPPHELSLDEILQKVQRDIAEGGPATN